MKAVLLVLAASLLVSGCSDTYRYPCQDPANKHKEECNRPACEDDGMCYDTLNGINHKEAAEPQIDETPAVVAENPKGE